jgi:ADP-heptose:LPS heptosyltransferase
MALWPWKQWPKERFRELALLLKQELGLQVIWFLERMEQALDLTSEDPVFCGPLDEVAAALGMCRMAVCSDSGLLHLSVAAGCHTIQLFGPGDVERFAHTGKDLAVHHDRSCSRYPCVRYGACANQASGWCMEKISVTDVFKSCSEFWQTVT